MKSGILLSASIIMICSCHSKKTTSALPGVNNLQPYAIQKKIVCQNGAVVSAHALASKIGIDILKQGGNAIDATVATQLALAVVYPRAGNIGGGGFTVARLSDGKLIALDYREMAPGKATRDMYVDENGNARTDKSQDGHLSCGVPGAVAGLFALSKYGKLSFSKLIQPAIDLAEKGFVITESEAASFNGLQKSLKKYNSISSAFDRSVPWKAGDTLVQTDLANTLKRIRDDGADGFYRGETAKLIVEEMKRGGGIISENDLKNYTAKFREPHVFDYKGYTIVSMPMPSSGGILLHQMMKMIEGRNIAKMGFESTQAVQLMTEVERRAFADRAEYMGDDDFYKVPVDELTNDTYLQERMKNYDPSKATPSSVIKPGKIPKPESDQTTHFDVIDKDGNAVSVTTTLNDYYGSKVVVGGAGFFLNDEMDDFSVKPGVPNMFGAVGGKANSIVAGKRMLSSMTPTIVLKNDQPYLIVGTPGGTTIPTSVFQTIVDILEFGMTTEDAIYKPKFHHQWLPDTLNVEKGFPQNVEDSLKKMGYAIKERAGIGRTEVIKILPDKKIEAVADNRGDDDAEGY
ncbi:MAG TPA: gamma-glutamyltransferase [Chitinophagaceae bacterium]|nr:gamma-glutamyltransferase [Chitinophagaceae bacterium]